MLRVMLPGAIAAGRPIGGVLPIIDVLPVGIVYKCVVVIDVGMNRIEDASKKSGYRLVGDVDYDEVFRIRNLSSAIPLAKEIINRKRSMFNICLHKPKN